MALVGTISGSNGTSNTAITGTLVVANVGTGFPRLPGDTVFFVSGSSSGGNTRAVFGGDMVTSSSLIVKGAAGATAVSLTSAGIVSGSSDFLVGGNVTLVGDVSAGGVLKSVASSGDEGGEILLAKPVTNTFVSGTGVTIDVWRNRIRIFEQGSPNKGGYWDIGSLSDGVGTNFAASSASPGGSDTYVQFNDGGAFGGQDSLTFNKVTKALTTITGSFYQVTSSLVYGSVFASGLLTLTDATNIAWDLTSGSFAQVTLGGARTLDAPSNQTPGGSYTLIVKQDSAGNRTLAFNSVYKFPGSTDPTITTASNAVDILTFVSDGTSMYGSYVQNFG